MRWRRRSPTSARGNSAAAPTSLLRLDRPVRASAFRRIEPGRLINAAHAARGIVYVPAILWRADSAWHGERAGCGPGDHLRLYELRFEDVQAHAEQGKGRLWLVAV